MKKLLIHLAAISAILALSVGLCYLRHRDPYHEYIKFTHHKPTDLITLLIPVFALAIFYFIAIIDWDLLLIEPVTDNAPSETVSDKPTKRLLPIQDHLSEQRLAEERLVEYTGRKLPGAEKPVIVHEPVLEAEPVNEGEIKDSGYEYISQLNKSIINHVEKSEPTDEAPKKVELPIEAAPVIEPEVKINGGLGWGVSKEFAADIAKEVKETPEIAEDKGYKSEIAEITAKLPDPLNDIVSYNHNRILQNNCALDEADRLEIIKYLKDERGFTGSTEQLSKQIIEKLEQMGKDYLGKQEVAAMLESDNSLSITDKKENSLKQRARKQLMENADFQKELFSASSK